MTCISPQNHTLTTQLEPLGATDWQLPYLEIFVKVLIVLFLTLFSSVAVVSAQASTSDVAAPATAADEAVNKLCPIGVEPIDGETFITYDGHKVGFCCGGCDTKFLAWTKEKKDAFIAAALAGQEAEESKEEKPADSEVKERPSEPYLLPTCPVSGEKLGSMGDPVVLTVEGREVKLCCKGCVRKIEKDPAKYLATVDEKLTADQKPYYPLSTCVVSGEPLVEDGEDIAIDVIVKNRLFRVCCKSCIRKLKADSETYFTALDSAVKQAQDEDYPLDTCIVRDKSKLGSMGDPAELVIGNRLVRFCCSGCQPKFVAAPATYLARLDAAWAPIHAKRSKAKAAKGDSHEGEDGHEHHKEGGH